MKTLTAECDNWLHNQVFQKKCKNGGYFVGMLILFSLQLILSIIKIKTKLLFCNTVYQTSLNRLDKKAV